jgi:hypothetical protein
MALMLGVVDHLLDSTVTGCVVAGVVGQVGWLDGVRLARVDGVLGG